MGFVLAEGFANSHKSKGLYTRLIKNIDFFFELIILLIPYPKPIYQTRSHDSPHSILNYSEICPNTNSTKPNINISKANPEQTHPCPQLMLSVETAYTLI